MHENITQVTQEEVLKIARISSVEIHEDELEALMYKLNAVLTYASRVQEIAVDVQEPLSKQVNIVRSDEVSATDFAPLLAQAPKREEQYFVVPKVLGSTP